jgi:hypothetical protein
MNTGEIMAGRQATPRQGKAYGASALLVVLVSAWYAGPAIASSNTFPVCDDVNDVNLEIPVKELQVAITSNKVEADEVDIVESDTELDTISNTENPGPDHEAILHEVFEETTTRFSESDEWPAMNARVPGLSDDELARYKRQMYRTDI